MLTRILGSLDESTFLRDYWGLKPAVLPGGDRHRFDGLFDLSDMEEYLFVVRPPVGQAAGDMQLVNRGQPPPAHQMAALMAGPDYDLQAVYNGLSEGYTLVLNAVHQRWPACRRLVDDLEDRLLALVQTNVYVTGTRGQGFAIHTDNHDVFVLQTHGTKRWTIYDRPGSNVLHEIELHRGDALYLPTGFPHSAETGDDLSIHLSVGIFPLSWRALARECFDAVVAGDSTWAEPVPLAVLRGEDGQAAAADLAARFQLAMSKLTDVSAIVDRYRRNLGSATRRRNPSPSGYARSVGELGGIDAQTHLERRPGVGCFVTMDALSASIHFMGDTIRAPKRAGNALRFVAEHGSFRVGQMDEQLTDSSKVVLARRLVREGLLQCVYRAQPRRGSRGQVRGGSGSDE